MTATTTFTIDDARAAGERIGIDWATSTFDAELARMASEAEAYWESRKS